MKFTPTTIDGLFVIDLEPIVDHRGFFARSWCRKDFADQGLEADWEQSNLQFSPHPGTMRGLHYQRFPHQEIKLARCTQGVAYDLAVDIRPDSPSYRQWFGVELTSDNHRALWIPKGCAHGWLSLTPDTEVFYMTSHEYVPSAVGAIRYDDPAFGIALPRSVEIVPADHDQWPPFDPEQGR